MRIFALIIFAILLNSCRNSSPEETIVKAEKTGNKKINLQQLNGKWYLNKWTYYHTLDFNGDSIYVDNHVDSVFYLKCRLSNDTLITWSGNLKGNSKKVTKNRILKISKDTLIFESFLNTKDEVHYSKKEREMEN